jgi:NAD(P)H-dependent FMN reductase
VAHGNDPRVVALCGSLRDGSRTRVALEEALVASRDAGATTELVDLRDYELPRLYAVDTAVPDAITLRETVGRADSVLLGTPNYHGSYSGALKDALDHCSRDEFERTTVGLLEVAAGGLPGSALAHLRTVSRTLRAWTLPTEVAIPDSSSTVDETRIADPDIAGRTRRLGRELVSYAGVADYPAQTERTTASGIDGPTDSRHTNT